MNHSVTLKDRLTMATLEMAMGGSEGRCGDILHQIYGTKACCQ